MKTFAYITQNNYNSISDNNIIQDNEYGIDQQTICFISDTGEIYTHGKSFGKGGNSSETITIDNTEIHTKIDEETNKPVIDPQNLPKAAYDQYGVVKIDSDGGLSITRGVLGINAAKTYNLLKNYIKTNPGQQQDEDDPFKLKPATKITLGGVYVPGGDGLVINTDTNKGKLTFDPTQVNMQSLWETLQSYFTTNSIQFGGGKSKLSELDDVNVDNIQNGYVLKWDSNNNRWNAEQDNTTTGNEGATPNGLQFYQNELKLSLSNGSEIPATTPVANSEYRGMIRAVSVNENSDYLNNDYASLNDNDELIVPLFIGSERGDAYIKLTSEDISTIGAGGNINMRKATRSTLGAVKVWDEDENVEIGESLLAREDNRFYPVVLDANDIAGVNVPWNDTIFDPERDEYINEKLNEAQEAADRVEATLDNYSTALNLLTEGTFAEDLQAAVTAIDAAEGDLATLHGWIAAGHSEGPVFGDDSTYTKIYDYLNPQSGSYASFTEAINTNLQDAITNNNGVLRSEVLNIVNANVPNTDGIVTTVKNQIISDGTFATQEFVSTTVQTGVNGLENRYSSGGLYIDSQGKVGIRTSNVYIDKGTTSNPNKQSFADGIYDAVSGKITQATATQIDNKVNEVGLQLDSSTGEFALITQSGNSTQTTNGPKINITDVAGVIGSTAAAASSVWAGIMARATVDGKTPSASIIADVNKTSGNSSIYLNADHVIVNSEDLVSDKIIAHSASISALDADNVSIKSRLTAAEASIGTLEANQITADSIISNVNGSKYLYVSGDPTKPSSYTSVLRPLTLAFGNETSLDAMIEATNESIAQNYANVSAWGATFYPASGQKNDIGAVIKTDSSTGKFVANNSTGVSYLDGNSLVFTNKSNTKIYDQSTWGVNDLTNTPNLNIGMDSDDGAYIQLLSGGSIVSSNNTMIGLNEIRLRSSSGSSNVITSEGSSQSSDIRYKNIIDTIHLDIADLAAAPKITYTNIGDTSGNVYAGTSAQYWQELIPQVVQEDETGRLSMSYANAAIIAAISVAEEVVALKNEIAELKQQIAALTSNN